MNEMKSLTLNGKKYDCFVDSVARENIGLASVEPAEEDIPKVFFGGALQQTKDEAVVPFRYISKTHDVSGYAEIKAQGNSSMSHPKKNQTVKMFVDEACESKMKVDFKGWGKQNKHVYKANWIDLTHARNVVSARLWGDVVKSRANYADLPELFRTTPNQGAVDGFPVKVYADGVYQGRYTLNIPKDKWTFNMDDGLEEHCVLCGENYVSGCFRAPAIINEADWTDEIHDTVPDSIKTRWNEVISFVMNATDEEFKAGIGDYFYVDSLIDYHLFGLMSCGLDAYGKNQIYATYDGKKWIACMYDMDSTWGLWWTGQSFVPTGYDRSEFQDFKDGQGNLLYIRLEKLFKDELRTRWLELRNGALSVASIINRFERFTDIASAELVREDYASTTGNGAFTDIPSKDINNIQQIRAFVVARHKWTDGYIARLTNIATIQYVLPEPTTFDGTSYIDTNIAILDEDRNLTFAMDFCPSADPVGGACAYRFGENRLSFIEWSNAWKVNWGAVNQVVEISENIISAGGVRMVCTHNAGSGSVNVRAMTNTGSLTTGIGNGVTFDVGDGFITSEDVWIGANQGNGDVYNFHGVINDLRFEDRVWTEAEIVAYLQHNS